MSDHEEYATRPTVRAAHAHLLDLAAQALDQRACLRLPSHPAADLDHRAPRIFERRLADHRDRHAERAQALDGDAVARGRHAENDARSQGEDRLDRGFEITARARQLARPGRDLALVGNGDQAILGTEGEDRLRDRRGERDDAAGAIDRGNRLVDERRRERRGGKRRGPIRRNRRHG